MSDIKQNLDKIKQRISDDNFLNNKGLSNEVGIHVFCYDPADEIIVRNYIEILVNTNNDKFHVVEKDLYKIFLEVLADMGVFDSIDGMEEESGKEYLLERLHDIADVESFMERIDYKPREQGRDVLFLTGVGKVYPFMRAHIILNKIQEIVSDIPIVLFYPGEYNGQNMTLFNDFFDGHYYRACNLL